MVAVPALELLEAPSGQALALVREAAAVLTTVLDGVPAGDLPVEGWSVREDAVLALAVEEVTAVQARLGELKLRLTRAAEQTQVANRAGSSGTDAWLAKLTGTTRSRVAGGLWLAWMLSERYPGVREVLTSGEIDLDRPG